MTRREFQEVVNWGLADIARQARGFLESEGVDPKHVPRLVEQACKLARPHAEAFYRRVLYYPTSRALH